MQLVDNKTIRFGEYNWRILKLESKRALIIAENILEQRWFHNEFGDVTWADCVLRSYLNHEFYNRLSSMKKKKFLKPFAKILITLGLEQEGVKILSIKSFC